MNKILLFVLVVIALGFAQVQVHDTIPRTIIYGISSDPFTFVDTVIGTCRRSGDKMYVKTIDGCDIFAAWTIEKNINQGEVK